MKILVSASSKHGSTASIAAGIAEELRTHGHTVDLEAPDYVHAIEPYDACVIGSAVFFGRWMEPARELVTRHANELRARPVWLFSSGPLGDLHDRADAVEGEKHAAAIGAREHRVFDGALDRDDVGLGERFAIGIARAPYGDFRNWGDIRSWARTIAIELTPGDVLPEPIPA
ncbi:MAG TPA: flavodoxin domain-containing protein [Candidatus Limnocylindrales bacterium]|nr:flavodoxin domain-containing protein [Candidatus Limnocylindrales bacterium]